MDDVAAA